MASDILACIYRGDVAQAKALAAGRALDLFEAAALGDAARVSALLDGDRELARSRAPDGFSALGLAAFFRQPACAHILIDAGAPVDEPAANDMRVTPLHSAAASGQLEIARWLLERGASVDARQHGGYTPLHAAAHNGDLPLVELLLAHGAERTLRTDGGQSAADLATKPEVLACLSRT
jgi:ankyrin repeat protein